MTRNAERLRKLEVVYQASQKCPRCHGAPTRVVYEDPETREQWNESMPESGCLECGAPPFNELVIVLEDDGNEVM